MLNAAAILALLSTLALGEGTRVRGIPVLRVSLFGYSVAGAVMEAEEAAAQLEQLVGRVRASLRGAAALAKTRGMTGGSFHLAPFWAGSVPMVDVVVLGMEGDELRRARAVVWECLVAGGFYVSRVGAAIRVSGGYL
jgi:hypothetical protein